MRLANTDQARSYATYENALKVLTANEGAMDGCTTLVAARADGRFVPVCIVRPDARLPHVALAHRGIFLVN